MIPTCVYIVDDDPAIRKSLAALLEAHGLTCRASASAEEFFRAFGPQEPSCVILDLRMPSMTGEEALRELRRRCPHTPAIVLTGHADVPVTVRTMKLGVVDFLEKPVDDTRLIEVVRNALERDKVRRQHEAEELQRLARFDQLTPRERELMTHLATGKTSKEIAAALNVSVKTVDNHRAHLLEKLKASNVAELVALAVRAGLA